MLPRGHTSVAPTIRTRAVALANPGAASTGCVVALDRHASRAMNAGGTGTLTFNSCALYANSDASDGIYVGGSGVVNAQAAYVVGNINGTVNTASGYGTYTGVNPIVDPYANVTMPSSSTNCSGWSTYTNGNGNLHLSNSTPAILKPSTAGGTCAIPHDVQLDSSSTLVLCPGVYVFNNSSNLTMNGQSTLLAPPSATSNPAISAACVGDLTGGVTIVFANSTGNPGAPTIGGGATVNLTAPTSAATAGIAVYQQRTT